MLQVNELMKNRCASWNVGMTHTNTQLCLQWQRNRVWLTRCSSEFKDPATTFMAPILTYCSIWDDTKDGYLCVHPHLQSVWELSHCLYHHSQHKHFHSCCLNLRRHILFFTQTHICLHGQIVTRQSFVFSRHILWRCVDNLRVKSFYCKVLDPLWNMLEAVLGLVAGSNKSPAINASSTFNTSTFVNRHSSCKSLKINAFGSCSDILKVSKLWIH